MTSPTPSGRILIGLRDLAGYGTQLKTGLNEIGVYADFLNLGGSIFKYNETPNSLMIETINWVGKNIGSHFVQNFILRFFWLTLIQPLLSLILLPWVLIKYDSIVFISNSTFFYFLDLPILKFFRKKIIFVLLGTESRPAFINGYVSGINPNLLRIFSLIGISFIQKATIRWMELFSTHILNTPPQGVFHEKEFINLFKIGLPIQTSDLPNKIRTTSNILRVLHAPSKSIPKRSSQIRSMIQVLKKSGYEIEYIEITGKSNHEVLEELSICDLVIDEVYSDTPLSKIAAEAAAYSKPSLVGSYYSAYISRDLNPDQQPPSFFCHPDKMADTLESLLKEKNLISQKGQQAKDFVVKSWERKIVAKKFLSLLNEKFPADWNVDLKNLSYPHGCGLSERELKLIFKRIYALGGSWLFLISRPKQILAQWLNWARE